MSSFTWIITVLILMFGAILLASCTVLSSENEPLRIACYSECDAEGNCTSSFVGSSAYQARKSEANLDTPTQTKVGMPDE